MSIEFSPIQYGESKISRFLFDAEKAIGKGLDREDLSNCESQLEVGVKTSFSKNQDFIVCDCEIDFGWSISVDEESGAPDVRAECKMSSRIACPIGAASEQEIQDALSVNGVMYVWGKIRDVVENASRNFMAGALILPAINPRSIIDDMQETQE